MKKSLIACFLMIIVSVSVHAQETDTIQIKHDKQALAMVALKEAEFLQKNLLQLGATASQVTQFKEIAKEYNQKMNDLSNNKPITKDKKFEIIMQYMNEKENKERQVLGMDKYNEYNRIRILNRQIELLN